LAVIRVRSRGRAREIAAAAVAAIAGLLGCGPPSEPPPNLVLLIGDDHGYGDYGFLGSPAQTPALDRLAAEGMVFRNGYTTSSRCRDALRTLLTGYYRPQYDARLAQVRAGLREAGIQPTVGREIRSFETLPELLGERGYRSFQGGKLFEGTFRDAGFSAGMNERPGKGGERIVRETMEPVLRFIDESGDAPFFLWFAPMLPHLPHDAPQELLDRYADVRSNVMRRYYASISWFDGSVATLMAELDRRGLRENTIVVYLSDNGWQAVPDRAHSDGPRGKGSLYDPGFRTAILFDGPGRIPAGVSSDALVSTSDVFATLLDYAGAAMPPGRDGRSLRPLIEGRAESVREEFAAYMPVLRQETRDGAPLHKDSGRLRGAFLRSGAWRYLLFADRSEELYDVVADPDETRDLAEERPEIARRLRGRLERWLAEMSQPPPADRRSEEPRPVDPATRDDL